MSMRLKVFFIYAICYTLSFSFKPLIAIPAVVLCYFTFLGFYYLNSNAPVHAEIDRASPYIEDKSTEQMSFFSGVVVILLAFILLHSFNANYFNADDNYAQFLPVILNACHSLFDNGTLAMWNPYLGMGSPIFDIGTYAVSYPIIYLSYLIAKLFLADEFLTLSVFAFIHIILGYVIFFRLGRLLKVRSDISALAAVSYVLCGFILISGRCWFYMLPLALWLPLLFYQMTLLMTKTSFNHREVLSWLLITGCGLGLFFHAGNAQMWVYSLFFLGLMWLILFGYQLVSVKRLWMCLSAFCLSVAVSAPLLIPQFLYVRDIPRKAIGHGITSGFISFFFPSPLTSSPPPDPYPGLKFIYMSQLYYSGTFLFAVGMVACLFQIYHFKSKTTEQKRLLVWVILGLTSLFLCVGPEPLLWTLLSYLPVFNKFKYPVKFLIFTQLFFILVGAMTVSRLVKHYHIKSSVVRLFVLLGFGLILYHVYYSRAAFYHYYTTSYPKQLSPDFARIIKAPKETIRVASMTHFRDMHKDFFSLLGHNFASLYGVSTINIYDPLVTAKPSYQKIVNRFRATPFQYLYAYGVKYFIFDKSVEDELIPKSLSLYIARTKPIYQKGLLQVYPLPQSRPLAYETNNESIQYQLQFDFSKLKVGPLPKDKTSSVSVNYLYYPAMYAVSEKGQRLPLRVDKFGTMVVESQHARYISIIYGYPLKLVLALVGACLMVAYGIYRFKIDD